MTEVAEALELVHEAQKPEEPAIMIPAPDLVNLPLGLVTPRGTVKDARVRELNGYDEEALVRAPTIGAAMLVALERATVTIGKEKATPAILKDLFLADRQELLVAISRCTWGSKVAITYRVGDETEEGEFDLDNLVSREGDPLESWFDVELPSGKHAKAHWALGDVHEALLQGKSDNSAKFTTLLLNKCVDEIDGMPMIGDAAKRLSIRDRQFLSREILERSNYGPQFDKTTVIAANGEEITPALTLGELFPI